MPPRWSWNAENQMVGNHNPLLHRSSLPQAASQVFPQALHLLRPPPAPLLGPVSLPNPDRMPPQAPTSVLSRDAFPIDLTTGIDFDLLARSVENHALPPGTTVYVLPTTRGFPLFEMSTGDRARRAFSIIRQLQTTIHAPLSLHVFRTTLSRAAQRAVRGYFVSRNRAYGASVWRSFLKGRDLANGPTGADLLRGHSFMWGFSQDGNGQWVIYVSEAPSTRAL